MGLEFITLLWGCDLDKSNLSDTRIGILEIVFRHQSFYGSPSGQDKTPNHRRTKSQVKACDVHPLVSMSNSMSALVHWGQFDELVQERRNSIANTLELHLSCTNPSKLKFHWLIHQCWVPATGGWKDLSPASPDSLHSSHGGHRHQPVCWLGREVTVHGCLSHWMKELSWDCHWYKSCSINSLGPHAACWAEAWDCQQPAVLFSLVRLAARHHAGYKRHFRALVLPPKLVILPEYLWFHDIWVLFVTILTWMASTNIDTQTSTENTLT